MFYLARRVAIWVFLLVASQVSAWAQSDLARQISSLAWQSGASVGSIAGVAQVSLRNEWQFLDATSSSRFLELNGNPPRSGNYVLAPRSLGWFAVFAFDPSGYVRDDDRLDPAELLETLKKINENSGAERQRLGLPILHLQGWAVAPHYDVQTRRLEWGTRLTTENGEQTVNYTIRFLGRSGVMSAVLVSDPQNLETDIAQFRRALQGFDFVSGERYTEFRQGDRVAEYGLAALIVGGAAAAAAKSGLLKGLGKLIGFGALAVLVAVAGLLRRLFGGKKAT